MPDKRFLGLGFTFNATDKGLEKKLAAVSSILSDISSELDTVNQGFKNLSKSMKIVTTRRPKAQARPQRQKPDQTSRRPMIQQSAEQAIPKRPKFEQSKKEKEDPATPKRPKFTRVHDEDTIYKPFRKTPVKKKKSKADSLWDVDDRLKQKQLQTNFDEMMAGFTKTAQSQIKDVFSLLQNSFPKANTQNFAAKLIGLGIEMDEFGKISQRDLLKVQTLALQIADQEVKAKVSYLEIIKEVFSDVKAYGVEVRNSFDNLFQSLGVDIAALFPKQLKAAFGAAAALLMGPFKLIKAGVTKLMPKEKKDPNTAILINGFGAMNGHLSDVNSGIKILSNQIGGPGSKTKNVYTATSGTEQNTKPKKKEFSIGDLFKDLFAGIGEALAAGGLLSILGGLAKAFGTFTFQLVKGSLFVAGLASLIVMATGFLKGFFEGIQKNWSMVSDKISEAMKSMGNWAAAVGGLIKFGINKLSSAFSDLIFSFLKANPLLLVFINIIEKIGSTLFNFVTDKFTKMILLITFNTKDTLSNLMTMLYDDFKDLFQLLLHPIDGLTKVFTGAEEIGKVAGEWFSDAAAHSFEVDKKYFDHWTNKINEFTKPTQDAANATPVLTAPGTPVPNSNINDQMSDRASRLKDSASLDIQQSQLDIQKDQIELMKENNNLIAQLLSNSDKPKPAQSPMTMSLNFDARKFGFEMAGREVLDYGTGKL